MSATSPPVSKSEHTITGTQHSGIEHAALHYSDVFNTRAAYFDIYSIVMPGHHLTTDAFYAAAQGAVQDHENEVILSRSLIQSYVEEESVDTKRDILENIAKYFKEAERSTKREIFIISPFGRTTDFFAIPPDWVARLLEEVVAAIRGQTPDFQYIHEGWTAVTDEDFGMSLVSIIMYHIHLRTVEGPVDASGLGESERIRDYCFWTYVNMELRRRQEQGDFIPGTHDLLDATISSEPGSETEDLSLEYGTGCDAQKRKRNSDGEVGAEVEAEIKYFFPDEEDSDPTWPGPLLELPPGLIGANVALPADQDDPFSQFFGSQLPATQALIEDLKQIFNNQHLLSLGFATCESILTRHGQDTSQTMVNTIREMYGAILHEKGLAYQKQTQAVGLRLAILFAAVIKVSEAQQLVWFSSQNQNEGVYHVETAHLDWTSVHTVAEGFAPEGFKGLYTAQVCEKLFKFAFNGDNKNLLLSALYWNTLREAPFQQRPEGKDSILTPNPQYSGTCQRCLTPISRGFSHIVKQ
ncbi:hypothetical protein FPSE5266_08526 [Fusarium pseudograminearum]|nr:hypothetical protein FPSE5266_08526 [Fusarium pseudograminearum]